MNYILNTERPHLFAANIKVIGKIDIYGVKHVDSLERAIQDACKQHEILNTYIKLSNEGVASYERLKKEQYVKITFDDWEALVNLYSSKRFKIEKGEMVKFFIIPRERHVELLIIAHHLVGDGLSITYLVESIMKTLSGETIPYSPIKIFEAKDFPKDTQLSFIKRIFVQNLNKRWLRKKKVFGFSDAIAVHDAYWKKHNTKILIHCFSEAETGAICALAKKYDVTVNSLLASIVSSVYEEGREIGVAVSVRSNYRGMANLVSGISVKNIKKHSLKKSIQYVHKSIYDKLNSNKKKYLVLQFLSMLDGSFIDSAHVNQYLNTVNIKTGILCKIMNYEEQKRNIGISNLSVLGIKTQYDDVSIDNYVFIPPLVPYSQKTVGIATMNNKMTITVHFSDKDNTSKEITLFNSIVEYLIYQPHQ